MLQKCASGIMTVPSYACPKHSYSTPANPCLAPLQVVELTVLSANGIELPASGVRHNDPGVQLSLSSPTTGHVSVHAFTYTEPVGIANASLAYAHPTAGEVSAITLTLELGDDLQVGDEVSGCPIIHYHSTDGLYAAVASWLQGSMFVE